jgi:hypothetical protein
MPHLWFLLRHVHRKFDELPDGGAWIGFTGQWFDIGNAF